MPHCRTERSNPRHNLLAHLPKLWELALTNQSFMVVSDSPALGSEIILGTLSLISPLAYTGDYRPYFTIYDKEFQAICNELEFQIARNIVLAVTNPYFLKVSETITGGVQEVPNHHKVWVAAGLGAVRDEQRAGVLLRGGQEPAEDADAPEERGNEGDQQLGDKEVLQEHDDRVHRGVRDVLRGAAQRKRATMVGGEAVRGKGVPGGAEEREAELCGAAGGEAAARATLLKFYSKP